MLVPEGDFLINTFNSVVSTVSPWLGKIGNLTVNDILNFVIFGSAPCLWIFLFGSIIFGKKILYKMDPSLDQEYKPKRHVRRYISQCNRKFKKKWSKQQRKFTIAENNLKHLNRKKDCHTQLLSHHPVTPNGPRCGYKNLDESRRYRNLSRKHVNIHNKWKEEESERLATIRRLERLKATVQVQGQTIASFKRHLFRRDRKQAWSSRLRKRFWGRPCMESYCRQ